MSTIISPGEIPGEQYSKWLDTVVLIEQSIQEQSSSPSNLARGGGGIRHRQIQLLLSNFAIEHGYLGDIEHGIQGTRQRVDVGIIGNNVRIACEVPISSVYKEYENIRKCLDAGFDLVVSVALERKTLEIVRNAIAARLTVEEQQKVYFCFPEHIPPLLLRLKKDEPCVSGEVQYVRGRRVRVIFKNPGPERMAEIRNIIASVLAKSYMRELAKAK